MTITFLYGNVGSGKTWKAVYFCIRDLMHGRRIFTNMSKLKLPYTVIVEPLDLIASLNPNAITDDKLKSALADNFVQTARSLHVAGLLNDKFPKTLLLDEISKWWDARNHASELNRFFGYFVDQCRKRNINLIVTDQHASGYDLRGRQVTDKLIRCVGNYYKNKIDETGRKVPYNFEYWSMELDHPTKPAKHSIIPTDLAKYIYPFYDTLEHIVPAEIMIAEKKRQIEIERGDS